MNIDSDIDYFTEEGSESAVISRTGKKTDPRLATVLSSLVRHLHAFTKDVELTTDEWNLAIDFLQRPARCATRAARNSFF